MVIFAGSIVFSPKTYAGVIVVIVAVLLFRPLRRAAAGQGAQGPQAPQGGEGRGAGAAGFRPASRRGGPRAEGRGAPQDGAKAPVPGGKSDDDMSDIEEILRKRGIS